MNRPMWVSLAVSIVAIQIGFGLVLTLEALRTEQARQKLRAALTMARFAGVRMRPWRVLAVVCGYMLMGVLWIVLVLAKRWGGIIADRLEPTAWRVVAWIMAEPAFALEGERKAKPPADRTPAQPPPTNRISGIP
jgi:hypothetical protein